MNVRRLSLSLIAAGLVVLPVLAHFYLVEQELDARRQHAEQVQAQVDAARARNAAQSQPVPGSVRTALDSAEELGLNPLVLGVLFTRGKVTVSINDRTLEVIDGTYVYAGGERLTTASDAIALLQLGGDGTLVLCPSSTLSVTRDASGKYMVNVADGMSRFLFPHETRFQVEANSIRLTPKDLRQAVLRGEGPGPVYVSEVVTDKKTGTCAVCDLKQNLAVELIGQANGSQILPDLGAGQVYRVYPATEDTPEEEIVASGWGGRRLPIPEELYRNIPTSLQKLVQAREISYLCQCDKLADYSEVAAQPPPAAGPGAGIQEPEVVVGKPEITPPVPLPELPPIVQSLTFSDVPLGEFIEFNPDELPPTAAGPPPEPPVVVAPPLTPAGGTGGGGVASAS